LHPLNNKVITMKNKMKIVTTCVAGLLASTALSSAQTVVSGNLNIGLKATSSDSKAASNTSMTKESQINLRNTGKLNVGGGSYVAGFSIELDGNDTTLGPLGALNTSNDLVGAHFENNYIDLIFGNTLLTFSADHIQPTNVNLTNILGGPHNVVTTTESIGGKNNAAPARSLAGGILTGEKGDADGFGMGLVQTMPGLGAFSAMYHPRPGSQILPDTGHTIQSTGAAGKSSYSVGFRGGFGVKGLDTHLGYNNQDAVDKGAAANADVTVRTVGAKYTMGQLTFAADQTRFISNVTATKHNLSAFGLAYAVDKDLTVGLNHVRTTTSAASTETEKIYGVALGYSLGPVALHITAGNIKAAAGIQGNDGQSVQASLGVAF